MTNAEAGDILFDHAIKYCNGQIVDWAEVAGEVMEAARRGALEEAAKACEKRIGHDFSATEYAEAIRELRQGPNGPEPVKAERQTYRMRSGPGWRVRPFAMPAATRWRAGEEWAALSAGFGR
ncbi:hypothetical protein BZM27_05760 [Paraburkholderia steynii]|uniref:Uncharacterized protein n=1 Tax=Paraburkholderia steynii TaxID=1245441 RepID=A0A4R0XFP1_9BURK|nr:hypothetical protein BZM27_05760 [Paraburkholderia steynii]